ncbi:MAG: membrane protein insertase YidC [Planctomycetota bacterium]|nr:MAG: membrane protein insertase YidC [Planctomycetota bacterium]
MKNKKILVQKTFHLYPQKYQISLSLKFQNLSEKKQNFEYRLNGPCGIAPEETFYIRLQGYIAKKNGDDSPLDLTFLSDSSLKESSPVYQESFKNISWVGVGNKYFAGLLYPNNIPSRVGGIGHFEMPHIKGRKKEYSLYSFFVPRGLDLPPKDPKEESYLIYIGPKDPKILEHYQQEGFDQVISYGWWIFAVFTKLFLAILKFFYFHIYPNYGLAIIFLTFLVKLCLLPLDYKAQKSMMMMQKLQPKMAAIQKKYKGKKGAENMQKQQQEIMQLYQEHGVNPLGGCLPMLLQLPVFIGLYQAFNMDISLRQASFFGWIKDLSMPDSLVTFAEPVHFLFFTFGGIHILPMIMVVLMVVQQMLQPKTDDPQQQQQRKMFMFMMVFMGLIFYNFPSGLVLYFICQSLVSLAEQKIIQRKLKAAEEGVS